MANSKRTKEAKVILTYEVAKQGQDDVKRINSQIKKNFEDAAAAIKRGGVAGVQEFKRLTSETRELEKELKGVEKIFASTGKNAPRFISATKDEFKQLNNVIKQGTRDVRDFDDEFSQASRQVALLGDVETGARTIGGGLGRVGLGGAEQGIAAISEIPASLEAIGRLKPALRGVPDAIGSLATSLGPTGIGLGAAAIVGVGAFALLSSEMNKTTEAAKKQAEQQAINAQTFADVQQAINADDLEAVGTMINQTTSDLANAQLVLGDLEQKRMESLIEAQMRVNSITREAAIEKIDTQGIGKLSNDLRAFETITLGLSGSSQEAISSFRVLDKRFNEAVEAEATLQAALREQSVTLQENNLTLADAVNAVKEVTEATKESNTELLKQAELRRSTILREAALMEQSSEALDDRLAQIENERTATQAAIEEITKSGAATEDATEALSNYNQQLDQLAQEQEFINSQAIGSAKIREAAIEAEQNKIDLEEERIAATEEATKKEEAMLKQRTALEEKFADALIDISKRAADESERALRNLESRLADLNKNIGREFEKDARDANRKQLEARVKVQRAEADALTDHVRRLQDIRTKASDDTEDAAQTRDFKAIFNIRRNARRSIEEEQRGVIRGRKDRLKEQQQAATDRQQADIVERQERLIKFNQDIRDTKEKFNQERALALQATANAIAIRRQQHFQELADLQQKSALELMIKRGTQIQEIAMLRQVESFAASAFGRIQSFASAGSFNEFSNRRGSSSGGDSITNNNVTGNVNVSTQPNQGVVQVGKNAANAIKGLLV